MGTNFYVDVQECENPLHGERLHIGKSSAGWKFCFHAIAERELTSWQAWREFLADRPIINEYGDALSLEELTEVVDRVLYRIPEGGFRCSVAAGSDAEWGASYYHDSDGYDFSSGEFS